MKQLYIETYGCQMNVADSEVVASIMKMAGYDLCDNEADADAIFLNTCSIRENAENKIYNRLETLHAEQKKGRSLILGVLGCMAERVKDELIDRHHANLVCGPDSYLNLPDMMAQCETGHNAIDIALSKTETYRDVIPQRIGLAHISGFVSIMRGCNNFCHYCIVPYTRGRERSRDVDSILREVADLRDRGFREVTLLGQNVNSYGLSPAGKREEGSTSFAQLLRLVARSVPDMRVRFTTSNPEDMTDDILYAIAEEPNLCHHIHFPAQSGSNKILHLMNRKYTREDYLERIAAIRRIIPDCGISTDLLWATTTRPRKTMSSPSRSCARWDLTAPSCSSTPSAPAPTPPSICPTMCPRRSRLPDSTSSYSSRPRSAPSRTARMWAASSTCCSRA